jgi:hypothetical protein
MLHAAQAAPVQLESCLEPDEKVVASIPCVGFDGFPDWGLNQRQQRVGHCVLAIIGSTDHPAENTCRIVLMHSGKMRGVSAREMSMKCCCASENSSSWDIERRQDSALAVLWAKTQLVAISSEQLDRLSLSKENGSENKCFYMLILLLPIMVFFLPLMVMIGIPIAMGTVFAFLWLTIFSVALYVIKTLFMGKTSIFGVEASEKQELQQLIITADEYESTAERGGFVTQGKDEWHAALYQFNYHAISLYCADPCTDQACEVIAVVQPSVSSDEIARFVLLADKHKMDRSSAKAHELKFVTHNRALRRAAEQGVMDTMDIGADLVAATGIKPLLAAKPELTILLILFVIVITCGVVLLLIPILWY